MASDDPRAGEGFFSRISGRVRRREPSSSSHEPDRELPFSPAEALRSLPDGAAVTNASGQISWANPALAHLLGRDARDLVGQSVALIAGPYASEREGQQLLECVRSGDAEIEATAISREGTSVPCLLRVRPLGEGDAEQRIVLLSELTQMSAMRAELAAKSELLQRERSILDSVARSLQDGIVVLDDTERVVLASASAEKLLDLGEGPRRGRALVELALPGPLRGEWLAFLASGETSSTQTITLSAGGRRRALLTQFGRASSPSGAPLGSVLLVRDLTTIRRSERARTEGMRQITHELRTPMQSIRGFAKVLSHDPELPEETRLEFCRCIEQESIRLGRAIETLLALAGRSPASEITDRRTQDLRPIVEEGVARALDALSRPDKSARVTLPDEPLSAWVDAPRLARAVQEITSNALLHGTSSSGIDVRARWNEESITVEVRDWGPGVPAEQLEEIFDPFFRLTSELSGETAGDTASDAYAFGLPFCRQVAEAHGGAIHAELPRGGGLKVLLELPGSVR